MATLAAAISLGSILPAQAGANFDYYQARFHREVEFARQYSGVTPIVYRYLDEHEERGGEGRIQFVHLGPVVYVHVEINGEHLYGPGFWAPSYEEGLGVIAFRLVDAKEREFFYSGFLREKSEPGLGIADGFYEFAANQGANWMAVPLSTGS
jgi:hypothetical protein